MGQQSVRPIVEAAWFLVCCSQGITVLFTIFTMGTRTMCLLVICLVAYHVAPRVWGEVSGAKSRVAGPNEITLSWVEKQSSDNKLGLCVKAVIKLCNCAA